MAFRFKGKNHAGQEWRAAGAIVTFGKQIEELRPGTFKSDGTVASKQHDKDNPTSDHRPNPRTGLGVVRALDFTETKPGQVGEVAEALRLSKDPRIAYFIFNGRKFSSTKTKTLKAWEWRPYTGKNPHKNHGHLSVVAGELGEQTHPFSISVDSILLAPARRIDSEEEKDDMWQYLTVGEELVQHAFDQGWLEPKTQTTLDFFIAAVRSGEINEPTWPDFRNFRVAVTNGIALSAGRTD